MNLSDIRTMSDEELSLASTNTTEELFRLRFQHHTGQLTNTAVLKDTKKRLARILTVQNERAQGITGQLGVEG